MRGNIHRPAIIAALLLLLGSLASALAGTRVRAAPDDSPAQDNVIISEFRSSGPSAGFEVNDDFVEIYNPTDHEIDIGGWFLKSITSSGSVRIQFLFASGIIISPGQHYLIAGNHYSGSSLPDGLFLSGGIPDDGGIALIGADNNTTIDKAGMSVLSAEGTALTPLSGNLDQSYERKPGGMGGNCIDSDDNGADFVLRAPSDPKSSTDVFDSGICAVVGETATTTPTETATPTDLYTFTETDTIEGAPTETGTSTLTPTETRTSSPTPTSTYTRTPSPTDTASPTDTPTYTLTRTNTPTPSNTKTGTHTASSTRTWTNTRTPTFTKTLKSTSTETLTRTKTPTRTPSLTRTTSLTRTPTYTRTITRTRTVTAIPGFVVINEFLPHPHSDWNEDGNFNDRDEYIELINLSTSPVNIKNWKLDNGANTGAFSLPDISLLPRQILVFFRFETNIPLIDSGGPVRLVKSNGQTADLFIYPPVRTIDRTWCRLFNGSGSLTFACDPTPGRPNVPFSSAFTSLNGEFSCGLSDAVPEAMTAAECSWIGEGIWNRPLRIEFWMSVQKKWDVFVE